MFFEFFLKLGDIKYCFFFLSSPVGDSDLADCIVSTGLSGLSVSGLDSGYLVLSKLVS